MSFLYKAATAGMRLLPAEPAHNATIKALKVGLGPRARNNHFGLETQVGGLSLPNPVALAAGFDKGVEVPDAILAAGFGFAECGTVTPLPQLGNPKPRLFRLTEDQAVINRMGFNNGGLAAFKTRLTERHGRPGIVGANLGANKIAPTALGIMLKVSQSFGVYLTISRLI